MAYLTLLWVMVFLFVFKKNMPFLALMVCFFSVFIVPLSYGNVVPNIVSPASGEVYFHEGNYYIVHIDARAEIIGLNGRVVRQIKLPYTGIKSIIKSNDGVVLIRTSDLVILDKSLNELRRVDIKLAGAVNSAMSQNGVFIALIKGSRAEVINTVAGMTKTILLDKLSTTFIKGSIADGHLYILGTDVASLNVNTNMASNLVLRVYDIKNGRQVALFDVSRCGPDITNNGAGKAIMICGDEFGNIKDILVLSQNQAARIELKGSVLKLPRQNVNAKKKVFLSSAVGNSDFYGNRIVLANGEHIFMLGNEARGSHFIKSDKENLIWFEEGRGASVYSNEQGINIIRAFNSNSALLLEEDGQVNYMDTNNVVLTLRGGGEINLLTLGFDLDCSPVMEALSGKWCWDERLGPLQSIEMKKPSDLLGLMPTMVSAVAGWTSGYYPKLLNGFNVRQRSLANQFTWIANAVDGDVTQIPLRVIVSNKISGRRIEIQDMPARLFKSIFENEALLAPDLVGNSTEDYFTGVMATYYICGGKECSHVMKEKYQSLVRIGSTIYGINRDGIDRLDAGKAYRVVALSKNNAKRIHAKQTSGRMLVFIDGEVFEFNGSKLVSLNIKADDAVLYGNSIYYLFAGHLVSSSRKDRISVPNAESLSVSDSTLYVKYKSGDIEAFDSDLKKLGTLLVIGNEVMSYTDDGYFMLSGNVHSNDESLFSYVMTDVAANGTTRNNISPGAFRSVDATFLYDVFYRPDIVQARFRGEDVSHLIGDVSINKALASPPPRVSIEKMPETISTSKMTVPYKIQPLSGGIAEVRVFHNGKLISSDGAYKDAPTMAYTPIAGKSDVATRYLSAKRDVGKVVLMSGATSPRNEVIVRGAPEKKCDPCYGEVEIDVIPGEENTVSVVAFNRDNTIQSAPASVTFKSSLEKQPPSLWILSVGIDNFKHVPPLRNARKDAQDFVCSYAGKDAIVKPGLACKKSGKANGLFKPGYVHVIDALMDERATKGNVLNSLELIAKKAKPQDTFVWFVASHGMMDANSLFGIVAYDTQCLNIECTDIRGHITSNEILEASKKIKAMKQLMVMDTCHSGGLDSKLSGLYDARVSILARNMGLHLYASAQSTEQAQDGQPGTNGTFTAQLLAGIEGAAPDSDKDRVISVIELGAFARQKTMEATRTEDGQSSQNPLIKHFGKDAALVKVME